MPGRFGWLFVGSGKELGVSVCVGLLCPYHCSVRPHAFARPWPWPLAVLLYQQLLLLLLLH